MASSKEKWSWSWQARNKPYRLVALSGLLLGASFPPSPLNHAIYVALVPLMLLAEPGVVPPQMMEDRVFLPIKRFFVVLFRLSTLQFLWRKKLPGRAIWRYFPQKISGNAQLFRYSYAAFFIWNLACCYWLMLPALDATNLVTGIGNVLAGVLAIALNPILMALPMQLHARLRHYFAPSWATLAFVAFWLTFEYLHMNWELGWPWLTLGNALSFHPEMVQYAEYTGVLGISAQVLLVNWLVYLGIRWLGRRKVLAISTFVGAAALVAGGYVLSDRLLDPSRPAFESAGSIPVRIVQPNIDPYAKQDGFTTEKQVAHYACMIASEPTDSGLLVMLPEKAVDQALEPRTMLRGRVLNPLWELVDSQDVEILTGLVEYEDFEDLESAPISARENYKLVGSKRKVVYSDYYNSAWIMNQDRSTHVSRKMRLVPMVERVPFLRGLRTLKFLHLNPAKGMQSYGRPDSLNLLYTLDSIPTSVLICYESAFGDLVRHKTALGAEWIAMITNDAWWRQSSGYVQHAGMSILRAIENRRAIARCANNGRSMFISATGEVSQATDWSTEAVIDARVQRHRYMTFYVQHGDWVGQWATGLSLVLLALGSGVSIWRWLRGRREAARQADEGVKLP